MYRFQRVVLVQTVLGGYDACVFLNTPCSINFTDGVPSGVLGLGCPSRPLSHQILCPQVMSMLPSLITPWQPVTSSGHFAVGYWAK